MDAFYFIFLSRSRRTPFVTCCVAQPRLLYLSLETIVIRLYFIRVLLRDVDQLLKTLLFWEAKLSVVNDLYTGG